MEAEATHRGHLAQVIADLKNSALAHLLWGGFPANAAWLTLAPLAFTRTCAAGALAGRRHARATTPTVRRQLIAVPARLAHSARAQTLHLPRNWPWTDAVSTLFDTLHAPPLAA